MLFKVLLFLSFFSVQLFANQAAENCSIESIPAWVKLYNCPLTPIPLKPSQVHVQCLHLDTQRNWEEKTTYYRCAYKTLTQSGVESVSRVNIDFMPSFEKVLVHFIRIFRNGQELDRLCTSRHKVIQRESDLEDNVYNGSFSVVYFLNDIREGDIVEYAFSVVGENPLFESHYTDYISLQKRVSVERISYRLLMNPNRFFFMKAMNTKIEPEVVDLTETLREWTWEVLDVAAGHYDPGEPSWYNPWAFIKLSEYNSWQEIALKLVPFYTLSESFKDCIPLAMMELIQKWQESSDSLEDCVLKALRFVQDEIRYLGLEEGIGAFVPSDPVTVFERRFGDCKDKSFLLHGLLMLMNVSSTPLLVHTYNGILLRESPPSPFAFNHVVLQIHVRDQVYFVDPTKSLQGGNLQTNAFPDYKAGLLVKNSGEGLIDLPSDSLQKPTEIKSSFILEENNVLTVKIVNAFYDSTADRVRQFFNRKGISQIEKENLSGMQKVYKQAKISTPIEVLDDRSSNVFLVKESYSMIVKTQALAKKFPITSFIIRDYLDDDFDLERTSPYAISCPYWVKEHIHIENYLVNWALLKEDKVHEHESFTYSQSVSKEGSMADFYLELRHLQDHVSVESLQSYLDEMDDIQENKPSQSI